jgi:hypothetical protein
MPAYFSSVTSPCDSHAPSCPCWATRMHVSGCPEHPRAGHPCAPVLVTSSYIVSHHLRNLTYKLLQHKRTHSSKGTHSSKRVTSHLRTYKLAERALPTERDLPTVKILLSLSSPPLAPLFPSLSPSLCLARTVCLFLVYVCIGGGRGETLTRWMTISYRHVTLIVM